MQEVDNILRILEETKTAIQENNTSKIKKLSDQTNNTASRTQDPDNIAVAVVVYAIGKILEREDFREYRGWKRFYNNFMVYLDKSINSLKKNNTVQFSEDIKELRREIETLSGKLKKYIHDVFRKASINKASKIYEHGISMEKTAKLLGITLYELAGYAGNKHFDYPGASIEPRERIKLVMDFFE
jgi:hypothetical protein